MDYQVFLTSIQTALQKRVNHENITVELQRTLKMNQVALDGISFYSLKELAAPILYLTDYYKQLQDGRSFEDITEEILELYEIHKNGPEVDADFIKKYSKIKSRIVYKVINRAWNEELLQTIPHYNYLDLAIVFYMLIDQNETGIMTTLIQNPHLDYWKVSSEELLNAAKENTPFLLPGIIRNIEDLLREILYSHMSEEEMELVDFHSMEQTSKPPMYVLTNSIRQNGAICLLYEDLIHRFSEQLETNLIIIPSSVHEVLLIPHNSEITIRHLKEMVSDINENDVEPVDRLSNQIYFYERASNKITLL